MQPCYMINIWLATKQARAEYFEKSCYMLYVKTENLVQLGSILKNLVLKNEEGIGLEKKDNFGSVFCKKKSN